MRFPLEINSLESLFHVILRTLRRKRLNGRPLIQAPAVQTTVGLAPSCQPRNDAVNKNNSTRSCPPPKPAGTRTTSNQFPTPEPRSAGPAFVKGAFVIGNSKSLRVLNVSTL